ncbi:type II toxin-antitoxin system PemK/MazF family toxin [Ekhidna sp.]|uniref:type II toxin-antitoxin system PemK/MazF family toxin n=1 Tax=Ekhidna sp. TaxID=2608089 RepID=UPI0032ECE005
MSYSQGDIILVPFPFTDQSGSKRRPAVVVSNSLVNNSNDLIIAQLTTQEIYGPLAVQIDNNDVVTPFKPPHNRQFIYCKKVAVIDKSLIQKKITAIKEDSKKRDVLSRIQSMFDLEQ